MPLHLSRSRTMRWTNPFFFFFLLFFFLSLRFLSFFFFLPRREDEEDEEPDDDEEEDDEGDELDGSSRDFLAIFFSFRRASSQSSRWGPAGARKARGGISSASLPNAGSKE